MWVRDCSYQWPWRANTNFDLMRMLGHRNDCIPTFLQHAYAVFSHPWFQPPPLPNSTAYIYTLQTCENTHSRLPSSPPFTLHLLSGRLTHNRCEDWHWGLAQMLSITAERNAGLGKRPGQEGRSVSRENKHVCSGHHLGQLGEITCKSFNSHLHQLGEMQGRMGILESPISSPLETLT